MILIIVGLFVVILQSHTFIHLVIINVRSKTGCVINAIETKRNVVFEI